ncbi:MAG: penicillin acylase family protein [Spirochaetota bacterium]|nr:MAG: penicillin acylase family protein [Spirochaetota bacterium]
MKRLNKKQIYRYVFLLLFFIGTLTIITGCASLFLAKGWPDYKKEFRDLPLKASVTVIRDKYGIPHIYAQNKHDLLVAQGFVHAQDRLWQMETLRRVVAGRLSEFAGEERVNLDYFVRILGFPELRQRSAESLEPEEIALVQAYIDGVNAYINLHSDDLPIEFQSAKHTPEEFTVEDAFSLFVLNSWLFRENYRAELMTMLARQTVELEEWKDIFPSHPNANLPDDDYFEDLRSLKIGALNEEALSFFQALPEQAGGGGTNLWVTEEGPGRKPLLANDTHIGVTLPNIWYLCHLNAPGIDVAGISAPGTPGIMAGHTDSVAWGIAVLYIDFVDLYIVQVNPQNPTLYTVGEQTMEMEQKEIVIGLPDGESVRKVAYYTIYGPVITELEQGVEGAVALRWYGTLPGGEITDRSMRSVLGFLDAKSVKDILEGVRDINILGFNFIAGDKKGNIGWHTTGSFPIRSGYSGWLPADGSSGTMNWDGFLPFEQMPGTYNPTRGFIINCNNRVVTDDDPHHISYSFGAPYRYERVAALLGELDIPTIEDCRRIQLDVYSLQAENILPKLFNYTFQDEKAVAAIKILKKWDRQVRKDSQGAAVYEVFLNQWVRTLLEDEIGENLFPYFHITFKKYLIQDVILDRPDSTIWDRKDTPHKETPQQILEMALSRTFSWLEEELGDDPRKWRWGKLHKYYWKHPGGTSWFTGMLLNRGPYAADGDFTTVNATTYIAAKDEYKTTSIPAVRMIIPLNDLDSMKICTPLGQSGQPGHEHYDDMNDVYIKGELLDMPVSREKVEAITFTTTTLSP